MKAVRSKLGSLRGDGFFAVLANGREVAAALPCSLEEFLLAQQLLPRSVVVELNGEAVAPSEFARHQLQAGDRRRGRRPLELREEEALDRLEKGGMLARKPEGGYVVRDAARLREFVERRRELVRLYQSGLAGMDQHLALLTEAPHAIGVLVPGDLVVVLGSGEDVDVPITVHIAPRHAAGVIGFIR